MKWIVIASACVAACTTTPLTDLRGERRFAAAIPKDVRLFVIDAQACAHFSTEPRGSEAGRDRFLDRMTTKTCTDLVERRTRLLHRYRQSTEATSLIKEVWTSEGLLPGLDP